MVLGFSGRIPRSASMKKWHFRISVLAALLAATGLMAQLPELVLANGRVMDPASGLDAIRHVGITDGRIVAVSETPISGRRTVDVRGLVVAPGFMLHIEKNCDSILERFTTGSRWEKRLLGFYRHAA